MIDYFYPLALSRWEQEEKDIACQVIQSGKTTMGSYVKNFETEFSSYLSCTNTLMVNSGSSANLLMAMTLKLYLDINNDRRKTILIPAVGWSTSYAPFIQLGFRVKLIDVSILTYNLDVDTVRNSLDNDVVAVLAINILGNPAPLQDLYELSELLNFILLEDNCESLGAEISHGSSVKKAGTFGAMSTHSFFFSHHINTMEGGCLCTSQDDFALLAKIIRNHGWIRDLEESDFLQTLSPVQQYVKKAISRFEELGNYEFMKSFYFILPGFNLRPTEIQGAIGSLQLKKLPRFIEMRRTNASFMKSLIKNIQLIDLQQEYGSSSYFGFGFIVNDGIRDGLVEFLNSNGVQVRPIVSGNIASHPISSYMDTNNEIVNAEILHNNGFFVGNHHVDFNKQINRFASLVSSYG